MKRQAILLALLFVAVLLQTTVYHNLPLNIYPDLALIFLVYFSFRYGSDTSQVSGFSLGLMEDLLSMSPLGFNCFIKTVIGFCAGLFHERLIMDPILFPFFTLVIVTLAKGLLSLILIELFGIPLSLVLVFSRGFFMEVLLNGLLAPVFFQLLRMLLDALIPERKTL